ncbi:histidine kinase dimerization/phospho-acceptor domain-containing protein [Altererythrobacter sp. ZODW24]|uniref:histidine kinase dimerization/phospho-acceptor domain-containing protein n=1 Tax=Altererythrobacter sp. ZODW24 TaxID=2185142 RepID=UPI000DF750A3|nr:histidine kinase dimerization/phospho-acceptor domain-containing protein [Altererythrobacter sp. ZODW24]
MHFDDRLATVLRHRASSERGAATQYRQLLDLLGAYSGGRNDDLRAKAFLRLGALAERVSDKTRAAAISAPDTRLRNPTLVARLAEDEPAVATAALMSADLQEDEWLQLIPALPIRARGLLRHRRDLPLSVAEMLALLGVGDNVLPQPEGYEPVEAALTIEPPSASAIAPTATSKQLETGEIGALVKRIESYRKARSTGSEPLRDGAPRLPLGETEGERAPSTINLFDFAADARGRINWASGRVAPALIGFLFAPDSPISMTMRRQQPVAGMRVSLSSVPMLGGEWQIDAAPQFSSDGGRYTGHVGRARRIAVAGQDASLPADSQSDRIRQTLHELRTPVNAIQGFAEVIQQQLFGPTPHEYRALAATIAGDAARMLAGFEELDRLAKLEAGDLELEDGESDIAEMLIATADQLSGMLRPRMSEFALDNVEVPCAVAMAKQEVDALVWRLMATLAGAVAAGEVIGVKLIRTATNASIHIDLPARFLSDDDIFNATMRDGNTALSAGMFGAGFALRLARAEAREAGGDLVASEEQLWLTLPLASGSAGLDRQRAGP